MSCNTKITQAIVNGCHPAKGFKPIAYWAFADQLTLEFSDNQITSISGVPFGVFNIAKFGLNAGHDAVEIDGQNTRYKHNFSTIINDPSETVDALDNIVVFLQRIGENTEWVVYGSKNGLWKSSQAAMRNDNLGTTAVSFESREGCEEQYSEHKTSIDIAAMPNMLSYSTLSGGTIQNGGVINFAFDAVEKNAFVLYPNNKIIQSIGGIINATYSGIAGKIAFYTQNSPFTLTGSAISGELTYTSSSPIEIDANSSLTGLIAKYASAIILGSCANVANLVAKNAVLIIATGCSLTAKSIGDILYQASTDKRSNVSFNFTGGNNALESAVDAYLLATYGQGISSTIAYLASHGGTILIDEV